MTPVYPQPFSEWIVKIILLLGFLLGVLLFIANIMQGFSDPSKGFQFNISMLEGCLFWGLWCFFCYILERRLSCGVWCLTVPPGMKTFVMSKKTSWYFAILVILILAFFGSSEMMLRDDSDRFFFFMCMILSFAVFALMLLFYMSFTEDRRKFDESSRETGPAIPQAATRDVIPASGMVAHNGISAAPSQPRFWETFFNLLKDPQPMLVRLRDISFLSSLLYFLALIVLISIPVSLYAIPMFFIKPVYGLVLAGAYGIIVGGWVLFGIVTQLFVFFLGGRTSFSQTFRTLFYATTPMAAIGWIPIIGNLAPFWGFYLMKCGLTARQDIHENIALIAVVASAVILVILFFLLLYLIIMGTFHSAGIF